MAKCWLFFGALLVSSPLAAEVKYAGPNGLEIESRVEAPIAAEALFRAFADVPRWWGDDHTYSGKSANLRFDAKAGGCWCETMPGGGGVEHMRIAFIEPDKRMVLTGSLGPLLYEATAGTMQVSVERTPTGSRLLMNYRVAGFAKGGADKMAPLIDKVLTGQLQRLSDYAGRIPQQR